MIRALIGLLICAACSQSHSDLDDPADYAVDFCIPEIEQYCRSGHADRLTAQCLEEELAGDPCVGGWICGAVPTVGQAQACLGDIDYASEDLPLSCEPYLLCEWCAFFPCADMPIECEPFVECP